MSARLLLRYLALGILYTFSVQMAWVRSFPAGVTPFLAIPANRYSFWQRFCQIPLFLVAFVTFAGTARLLALAHDSHDVDPRDSLLLCRPAQAGPAGIVRVVFAFPKRP